MRRPSTIVVASTLREAEGYARTLPQRHVAAMTHLHAATEGGLTGVGRGTTIHVLPVDRRAAHLAMSDRLSQVLAPLQADGVVVVRPHERSPRRRPATAARGATKRNRQSSKEEPR